MCIFTPGRKKGSTPANAADLKVKQPHAFRRVGVIVWLEGRGEGGVVVGVRCGGVGGGLGGREEDKQNNFPVFSLPP